MERLEREYQHVTSFLVMVIWCVLLHRCVWADFRKQSLFPQLLLFDEDQRVKDVVLEMMRVHKLSAIIRYRDGRREFFGYVDAWTYRRLTPKWFPNCWLASIGTHQPSHRPMELCFATGEKNSSKPWDAGWGYYTSIVEVWLVQSCRVHELDLRSPGRVKSRAMAWETNC